MTKCKIALLAILISLFYAPQAVWSQEPALSSAVHTDFALTLTGQIESVIELRVNALEQTGHVIEINEASLISSSSSLLIERLGNDVQISFPIIIEVRQSGVTCSTVVARLEDYTKTPITVLMAMEDDQLLKLDKTFLSLFVVRDSHSLIHSFGKIILGRIDQLKNIDAKMVFESVIGCDK